MGEGTYEYGEYMCKKESITISREDFEKVKSALNKGVELLSPFQEISLLGDLALDQHHEALSILNHAEMRRE